MAGKSIKTVGVIGLGSMGRELARHLAKGGFSVVGYDVKREAVEAAKKHGVAGGATPAETAAKSDLVIVGVGFDSEVEAVVFGKEGLLAGAKPGSVIAIASTIAPETMKKMVKRAKGKGVEFLDIPMCRGEQAAIDGELLLMAGGDKATFEACKPAFATFANSIHYLGDIGAGQVGKLVNNLILWACISSNYEGFKLAKTLGVELDPLRDALMESSADNWAMRTRVYQRPMPWAEKDMTIVLKEADHARVSLPLCGTIKEVIKGIKIEAGQAMPREPE